MFKKIIFKKIFFLNIKIFTYIFFLINNFFYIFKKNKKNFFFFFNFKKNIFFFVFKKKKKNKKKKNKLKINKFKEVRFGINIHLRDYLIKIKKVNGFLLKGYTVKVSVYFKGREIIFKEKGIELILKFQNNIKGIFFKFSDIEFENKYVYSIFMPKIKK